MTDSVDEADGRFEGGIAAGNVRSDDAGYLSSGPMRTAIRLESGLRLELTNGEPTRPTPSASRSLQLRLKRLLDLVLSLTAIIALAPVLIGTAVLIKLTSAGPVFYRQRRPGLYGRPFELLKFRSMRLEHCDADGLRQAQSEDERVTRLGRILRATSIDELPQLWNILVGDMSVIGPRPMVEGQRAAGRDYRDLVAYYEFRQLMKPGLSGWAQANGLRGPTDEAAPAIRRIDHDCAYIQNFSIWLDVRTIGRTLVREFINGTGL